MDYTSHWSFRLGPNTSPRDTTDITDFQDQELADVTPSNVVVKFFLFLERWRCAEIENCEMFLASLKADCVCLDPAGTLIHPSGVELSLRDAIKGFRSHYGDKRGQPFWIWVGRVLPTKFGSDTWLIKFNQREMSGYEQLGCFNTALINIKNGKATYVYVHQTWMEGSGAKDQSTGLF